MNEQASTPQPPEEQPRLTYGHLIDRSKELAKVLARRFSRDALAQMLALEVLTTAYIAGRQDFAEIEARLLERGADYEKMAEMRRTGVRVDRILARMEAEDEAIKAGRPIPRAKRRRRRRRRL